VRILKSGRRIRMKRNRIRVISILLSAIFCINIAFPNITALAGDFPDVIYIRSAEDLILLSKNCSLDTWSRGKTVILCSDIDLTGTGFSPIPVFSGTFDGQGYTVSGLTLDSSGSPTGLFRYIQEDGLVKNLKVSGTITPAGEKTVVGGVAGNNRGTILNCVFVGIIRGDKYVGGIAGINEANGLISNCSVQGIVNGSHHTGGIAGENLGTILLCTNEASVNTTLTEKTLNLENIQDINPNLSSFSAADFLDVTDTGGIAGISTGIIQSCTNLGTVGYPHVGYNIGGIAGRQSGYINGCTNKGIVFGRKDVGGIAGQTEPYSTWQISESFLTKLRTELNTLQVLVNNAINNINRYNYDISAQLTRIHGYVTDARTAVDSLADQTVSWLNDNISSMNDVSARITQTLVAMEPVMELVSASARKMEAAIGQYGTAMKQLKEGTESFNSGADIVYPALDKMKEALKSAGDSADNISSALSLLKKGLGDSKAVEKALSDIRAEMTNLINALEKTGDAARALLDTSDKLKNSGEWLQNRNNLRDGADELAIAIFRMTGAMRQIQAVLEAIRSDIEREELLAAFASMENAVSELASAADKFASGFSKISAGLEKLANPYEDNEETQKAWQDIENGLKTVNEAVKSGSDIDFTAVLQGFVMIQNGLAVLMENINNRNIRNGLTDIYNGMRDFSDAVENIQASANYLKDMTEHLKSADINPAEILQNLDRLMTGFANLASSSRDAAFALMKINSAITWQLQWVYDDNIRSYIREISDSISEVTDALKKISGEAEKLSEQIELEKLFDSIKYMEDAAGDISRAFSGLQSVISGISDAWPYFDKTAESVSKALSSAIDATDMLKSSAADMAEAIEKMHALISDLAARPEITFKKMDSRYIEAMNELSAALGNVSGSLSVLKNMISDSTGTLLSDIQAVSDQLFSVFSLLTDTLEDVSQTNIRDYFEDISAQEAYAASGGEISAGINFGTIQGDINVGGIAGSMAIEYDFDPEDDYNLAEKISPGTKYLLRAVISGCENYGTVKSKKNHAGGIVGLMDFGYVVKSLNNGSVSSTDGDYVGGIAGKSKGIIRKCYSKSSLSGDDYIGGIAGYGTDIYECCSLIRLENADEYVGAIAGYADGVLQENYFVYSELAGINGISYEGKAEPVSFDELLLFDGLPDIFRTFRLRFVCDGKEVAVIPFTYGESIPADKIPEVPGKDGYFGEWSMNDFKNLTFDATVKAIYKNYITTLASTQTRNGGPSVILVDGLFTGNSVLTARKTEAGKHFNGEKVLEKWTVSVTDDGQMSHTVRYLAPDRQTSGINIYLLKNGTWEKTDYRTNGSYLLFTMDGTEITFIVTSQERNTVFLLIIIPAVLLAAAILLLIFKRRTGLHIFKNRFPGNKLGFKP